MVEILASSSHKGSILSWRRCKSEKPMEINGQGFLRQCDSNEVLGNSLFLNVLLEEQFECQRASCPCKNRGMGCIENSPWPCWEASNTGQVYWSCREQSDFSLVFIGIMQWVIFKKEKKKKKKKGKGGEKRDVRDVDHTDVYLEESVSHTITYRPHTGPGWRGQAVLRLAAKVSWWKHVFSEVGIAKSPGS